MKITEKRPGGRGSFKEVFKWWSNIDKNMTDATPYFRALVPGIKQSLKFTFSDSNPAGWPMTSQKWRDWKTKNGYPATVGVMTEGMKRAFSVTPEVNITKQKLHYTFDGSETGYKGKPVKEYAPHFNRTREILKYARKWLKKNYASKDSVAVKKWLAINKRVEK